MTPSIASLDGLAFGEDDDESMHYGSEQPKIGTSKLTPAHEVGSE